ncbi:MAG: zinc uptake transcriptional repressor [Methanomassiliicoccales archaeon PtaU1.Bin124]|nr:MAG: zinc uptake transcriptional repressor [Methanomassiliicoccales archaeon PtaU1.Bin124]
MNGRNSRWTKQLKLILDIVYESDHPITADEVYTRSRGSMPNISLGTVYRNLNKLVSEGLVSESNANGISTFCKHPFPNTTFECSSCRKLVSVPVDLNVLELSKRSGMAVERYTLQLHGVCKGCQRKCT